MHAADAGGTFVMMMMKMMMNGFPPGKTKSDLFPLSSLMRLPGSEVTPGVLEQL